MKHIAHQTVANWTNLFADVTMDYSEVMGLLKEKLSWAQQHPDVKGTIITELKPALEYLLSVEYSLSRFVDETKNRGWLALVAPSQHYKLSEDERYVAFVEKVYFDLFHSDPDFKPDLLKLIDPETGELRPEYTKKNTR